MKLIPLIAAAGLAFMVPGVASASVVPAEAPISASATSPQQTHVRISVGQDRRYHRGYDQRRHYRRHHARKAYWRRDCRSYWRHGERHRVCKRVRHWR